MTDRNAEGFTLVELLVSLAILAIALAVLFGAIGQSLDRVRRDKDEAVAAALVQSLLARAGAEPRLAAGATDGDYSNGFHWRLIVRPYGNTDDSKAWGMSAYSVSATVSWRGGERTLTTLRLVPPVKPP